MMISTVALSAYSADTSPVELQKQNSPEAHSMIKDYGLKDYIRVSKDLPHSENKQWKLVCTMPYNCHFQPWIQVESPQGKVIRFNSSNPLVLYLTATETYTTTSGEQTYSYNAILAQDFQATSRHLLLETFILKGDMTWTPNRLDN